MNIIYETHYGKSSFQESQQLQTLREFCSNHYQCSVRATGRGEPEERQAIVKVAECCQAGLAQQRAQRSAQ